MEDIPSQRRFAVPLGVCAIGVVVFWLAKTPFGLLAPMAALFLFARGRAVWPLHAASVIGLTGSLYVAAFHETAHDLAATWAAFFAVALCIGAIVASSVAASPRAEALPAAIQSTTREQTPSYPVIGPSLDEKAAPRDSPIVGIAARDDKATTAQLVAVSFWGGLPLHLRYWRRQPDGRYRWIESRSEPLSEPSGTRLWRAITAEVDDQGSGKALPAKIASNPPSDNDAIRAAKIVENLLGNAWAFDPAGKPTYLTPLAQTFVAVTLEEFQAVVDEGHTFFKRTAHPDDYDRISAAWRRSLQTGDPFFLDRRIRRASGIHEWNRTGFVPTRDRQGRITGWYGSTIDLDSHRIAQAELRDRERELSQLVDMVPSHLWRLTPQGEPIFFNKRMVDFLGLDVANMDRPGINRLEAVIETVHPDDAAEFGDTLRRCLMTGESFALRYRLRRSDGVYRWMSSHAEPMHDPHGRIVQWYGLSQDIDDQLRAEEALRESERKLQQMIDALPVRIWSATSMGGPMYFNKRYQDYLRSVIPDFEALGEPGVETFMQELIHPEDAPDVRRAMQGCFETGNGAVIRFRWREKEGNYRWSECRVEPRRDQEGAVVQWYGASVDIDDEVRAQEALRARERALRQSERQLQQMIDAVPAMIWSTSHEGRPEYVNKRFTDVIGATIEHLTAPDGSPVLGAIIHPDDIGEAAARVRESLRTGIPYVVQCRQTRRGGSYRWTETRAEAWRDESGEILRWYGVSVDIHDMVTAQEALREASAKLARATQAASLAELSASIAHEVNQPLAAIVANSHACQRWLSADPANVERAKTTVERVIRDANAAADVVSRIRALFSQSVTSRDAAELPTVIAEACDLMADEAARQRVRIAIDVERDLPLVVFDRVQIQQVLINLIRNGMDAMDATADDRIVGMCVRRIGDVVRTEISDCGRGVELPDKIFEPFFTTKENGMGMGLAICRSIIESHGGRLWAQNNAPHGATFIFTLPLEEKAAV